MKKFLANRPAFFNKVPNMQSTKPGTDVFNSGQMKRYYSSLDMEIYFGDFYIDEIVSLEYQVRQNNLPLFGYNSYIYDEVAKGSRLIEGSFTINFTKPNYLFDIMNVIGKNVSSINDSASKFNTKNEGTISENANDIKEEIKQNRRALYNSAFDIDIMFGENRKDNDGVHTILSGIVLQECYIEVNTSGVPILERYRFIGRDIKTDLS